MASSGKVLRLDSVHTKALEDLKKSAQCVHCHELMKNPCTFPCGHHYCEDCAKVVIGNLRINGCGVCKGVCMLKDVVHNKPLAAIVLHVERMLDMSQRLQQMKLANAAAVETGKPRCKKKPRVSFAEGPSSPDGKISPGSFSSQSKEVALLPEDATLPVRFASQSSTGSAQQSDAFPPTDRQHSGDLNIPNGSNNTETSAQAFIPLSSSLPTSGPAANQGVGSGTGHASIQGMSQVSIVSSLGPSGLSFHEDTPEQLQRQARLAARNSGSHSGAMDLASALASAATVKPESAAQAVASAEHRALLGIQRLGDTANHGLAVDAASGALYKHKGAVAPVTAVPSAQFEASSGTGRRLDSKPRAHAHAGRSDSAVSAAFSAGRTGHAMDEDDDNVYAPRYRRTGGDSDGSKGSWKPQASASAAEFTTPIAPPPAAAAANDDIEEIEDTQACAGAGQLSGAVHQAISAAEARVRAAASPAASSFFSSSSASAASLDLRVASSASRRNVAPASAPTAVAPTSPSQGRSTFAPTAEGDTVLKTARKIVICTTSLTVQDKALVMRAVSLLQQCGVDAVYEMADTFIPGSTTHLITATELIVGAVHLAQAAEMGVVGKVLSAKRTLKVTQALLCGCWIVGMSWVQALLALSPTPYVPDRFEEVHEVWGTTNNPANYTGAPRKLREAARLGQPPLFTGLHFAVLTPLNDMRPEEMREIVRSGGGTCESRSIDMSVLVKEGKAALKHLPEGTLVITHYTRANAIPGAMAALLSCFPSADMARLCAYTPAPVPGIARKAQTFISTQVGPKFPSSPGVSPIEPAAAALLPAPKGTVLLHQIWVLDVPSRAALLDFGHYSTCGPYFLAAPSTKSGDNGGGTSAAGAIGQPVKSALKTIVAGASGAPRTAALAAPAIASGLYDGSGRPGALLERLQGSANNGANQARKAVGFADLVAPGQEFAGAARVAGAAAR